ncbi:hypothetical protein BH11PAT1_BH11PAT1_7060 [soil metagenome]
MQRSERVMQRKEKSKRLQKTLLVIGFLLLIFFGRFIIDAIRYSPVLIGLLINRQIDLKKAGNTRVNILLLGIGGGKHDGPNLTDTIIFASLDTASASGRATLVSLPRDLWVPDLKAKINTAYAFGEDKQTGGGLILAKATVGKILNQQIDYGIRIDFAGFVKAVDMIGGLDLRVERTFDDYEYPISGKEADDCGFKDEEFQKRATDAAQLDAFPCRYEHLHFAAGNQHMDGETALRFVRSRHAEGQEGSDFARSQRQEKVIAAFKDKVFSVGTLLNPIKLNSLYDVFKGSIDTDIKQNEYDDFIRLAEKMRQGTITTGIIDTGDEGAGRNGFLMNPPIDQGDQDYGLQWVLIPTAGNGNFSKIQSYIACVITTHESCLSSPTPPTPARK